MKKILIALFFMCGCSTLVSEEKGTVDAGDDVGTSIDGDSSSGTYSSTDSASGGDSEGTESGTQTVEMETGSEETGFGSTEEETISEEDTAETESATDSGTGEESDEETVEETNSSTELESDTGDVVEVPLWEDPTTNYKWAIEPVQVFSYGEADQYCNSIGMLIPTLQDLFTLVTWEECQDYLMEAYKITSEPRCFPAPEGSEFPVGYTEVELIPYSLKGFKGMYLSRDINVDNFSIHYTFDAYQAYVFSENYDKPTAVRCISPEE